MKWIPFLLACLLACPHGAPRAAPAAAPLAEQSRALTRAHAAVLGLRAVAVDDARSAATLGLEREGSGILIGADGLVLTIGYLVLEAESVALVDDAGQEWPARVVAYDVATGLGLVQALAPLQRTPVPLGQSARVKESDWLVVVSGGEDGTVSMARLLSRRPFSGGWEYHLEEALYTAPARQDHSGAGLFTPQGELVGVGSLLVGDALGQPGRRLAGNLFVPVDILKPVIEDLKARGRSAASRRAWLGLHCAETPQGLRVERIAEDSPADVAGLLPGDAIERIDGQTVRDLGGLWTALWRGGPAERAVTLDIVRDGEPQRVVVHSVDRMTTLRRPQGI